MTKGTEATPTLELLTPEQLFQLGAQDIAYVKPVSKEGITCFAVHAADGTEIAVFEARDVAFAACRQHDLEPVSLH